MFLDKPLPARCIGSLEKQTMALKRMLRILTCKRHAGGNVDYSQIDRTAEKRWDCIGGASRTVSEDVCWTSLVVVDFGHQQFAQSRYLLCHRLAYF